MTSRCFQLLKENDKEYVILEESFRDMSIEQLDLTLNESQLALQVSLWHLRSVYISDSRNCWL